MALRAFATVIAVLQAEHPFDLYVEVHLWDGLNAPSIQTIFVEILHSDNEVDLKKKTIDRISSQFGVAKNDVVYITAA